MALCCQFPFQGSSSPSLLVLGVHLPAIKSFFSLLSSSGSVPRQEGAASSATQLCPAASHLHSEQWRQSSALYKKDSQAGIVASKCISVSPRPEIRILIFNPSERSRRPFASKQPPAIQHSPKEPKCTIQLWAA